MKRLGSRLIGIICIGLPSLAVGQHPSEVQRLTAEGNHYAAMMAFETMPKRTATIESRVSVGRSAWALGLPERASEEFDKALRSGQLKSVDAARLLLSKGIIELQEARPHLSVMHAERAFALLPEASPLRSRILLLWAEALHKEKQFGLALPKYSAALIEADEPERAELYYLRAVCRQQLGNLDEARADLMRVPLRHERAPEALRLLAQIALDRGTPAEARLWLERGRLDYSDHFIDSWVDYGLVQAAISEGNLEKVRLLRRSAVDRFPPSDGWLILLEAAVERFEWHKLRGLSAENIEKDGKLSNRGGGNEHG